MKKELSRCGYRCDLCAARSDDPEIRQKLVDGWYKYFGHQNYTAEMSAVTVACTTACWLIRIARSEPA